MDNLERNSKRQKEKNLRERQREYRNLQREFLKLGIEIVLDVKNKIKTLLANAKSKK